MRVNVRESYVTPAKKKTAGRRGFRNVDWNAPITWATVELVEFKRVVGNFEVGRFIFFYWIPRKISGIS